MVLDGGVDNVVTDNVEENPDKFPHPSNALTRMEYDVAGERPVNVYVLGVLAVVLAMSASRYTLYPVTATLSLAAFQEILIEVVDTEVLVTPPGTLGPLSQSAACTVEEESRVIARIVNIVFFIFNLLPK